MTDITIRKLDEGVINALTEQSEKRSLSREALIKQILADYVARIGIPSKGYIGYAPNGTEIHLTNAIDAVTATTAKGRGLNQEQITALRRAELLCQPKNGSRWAEARKVLEEAGFEVFEP